MSDWEIVPQNSNAASDWSIVPEAPTETKRRQIGANMSPFMAGVEAFNLGAEKLPMGILQLLSQPLDEVEQPSSLNQRLQQSVGQLGQEREAKLADIKSQYPVLGFLSELGGGVASSAPLMAIPGLQELPLIGEGAGFVEPVTTGIAQGALTGAGQYVNPGESRLANAGIGGLLGGGTAGLLSGAGMLGSKIYNAVKGVFTDPQQQAVYELAKQYNVPISAPDIMKNPVIKKAGEYLDKIPFIGTQEFKQGQMESAKTAAEQVKNKYQDIMTGTKFGGKTGLKQIRQIAQGEGKRANQARELLSDIDNAGDDWNKIMQASGNVKLFRNKLIADRKYDKLATVADQFGAVDTSNIQKAIDNMIAQENKSVIKNKDSLNLLNEMNQGLQNRSFNFTDLRQFRSDLSSRISDYFKGNNAAVGEKGVGALQSVKDQIDKTLNNFAQSKTPELKTLWKNADNHYRYRVVPAKDRSLAQALKNADADTIYSKFITTGTREGGKGTGRAQRFYNALDDKGRAAIRYGMVSDAFEKALKDDGQFSPAQFASHLNRYTTAKDVVFKPQDKAEIDGFKNLMRHVQRSYQELNLGDTGVKTIPYIIGGLVTGSAPLTAAKLAGMTLGLKQLFTTDAGKRFLLASSKLKDTSPGLQSAVEKFAKILQQGITQYGVDESNAGDNEETPTNATNPFIGLTPKGAQ